MVLVGYQLELTEELVTSETETEDESMVMPG